MKRIDYRKLPTEQRNRASERLDSLSERAIVRLMNREDRKVVQAVAKVSGEVAEASRMIVEAVRSGGRVIFVGAGTSGRMGVLESAELPPTFNTPPALAQAVMAGGKKAVFRSQEGAEDNEKKARAEIQKRAGPGDVVIGIAASGVTPFVRSALLEAKKKRCRTVLVTCNPEKAFRIRADVVVAPKVGPEVVAGSTRLKSGTATKMVLNMMTTAAMVRLGKVYGNRMVDLQPRCKKLRERGIRLVGDLTGLGREASEKVFIAARGHVKTAVVMASKKIDRSMASELLRRYQGLLHLCLKK